MSSSFNRRTLCLFVLSLGLLLNLIIPPFQNPDEPPHLKFILIHAFGEKRAAAAEADIIQFMDKNNWWRFTGLGRPETLPTELSKTDFIRSLSREVVTDLAVELYHILVGKTVGLFIKKDIETFYYLSRLISLLLYLGSMLLVFSAFGKISISDNRYLVFGALFILFLPQFALVNFSVNPDALSIFFSCLFFYTAAALFADKFKAHNYLLLVVLASAGFFTDKSVFSLFLLLFIIPLFFIRRMNLKKNLMRPAFFFWILILLLSWVVWFFPTAILNSLEVIKARFLERLPEAGGFFSPTPFNRRFFSLLIDSSFLRFGWMQYAAERIFYLVLRVFLLSSLLGLILYFGRALLSKLKIIRKTFLENGTIKLILFFSISFALQLFLTWIVWASKYALAQGRYLFPVIIPVTAVFTVGIYGFFSVVHKKAGKVVLCALALAGFLFFNYTVWNYFVPVFHLTQKTPLPGL